MADKTKEPKVEKSTLLVDPPKSETDKLRDAGVEIQDPAVAGLPGGGPACIPGMSAGGSPPAPTTTAKK